MSKLTFSASILKMFSIESTIQASRTLIVLLSVGSVIRLFWLVIMIWGFERSLFEVSSLVEFSA